MLGVSRESIPFWCEFHTFFLTVYDHTLFMHSFNAGTQAQQNLTLRFSVASY